MNLTAQKHAPTKNRYAKLRRTLVNYSFVAPTAIFLLLLIAYPMIFNIRMSFQDLKAINLLSGDATWVGFENYRNVLSDNVFRQAIMNTFLFTFWSIVFQLSIGLALALFYNQRFPGSTWMRSLYLVSWTVPAISVAAVFRWLFDGQVGVINWLLNTLGVIDSNVFWFSDPKSALGAIITINVWLGVPFNMALLLAGLQGIPRELYEAAEIDGATQRDRLRYVTLPLLRPTILAVLLLGLIYTFKVFDVVWATTQGGPFNSTHVISTLAFSNIFQQFLFGPGAAMLNLLFIVLFIVALLYLWNLRREEANA